MLRRLFARRRLKALVHPKGWAETEAALEARRAARADLSDRSRRAARTIRLREISNDPFIKGENA